MRNTKKQLQHIAILGFTLLEREKAYQQTNILRKLQTLGKEVSAASLSNILGGKQAGFRTLRKVSKGIQEIIESELGRVYDDEEEQYVSLRNQEGLQIITIPEHDPRTLDQDKLPNYIVEGRPTIQEKVEFLSGAQREITELGVRLKTFTDYFFSRSEHEFARPVKDLLVRGVHLNLYLLDPDCNEAHLYFRDRARVMEEENTSIEEIRRVIGKLGTIHAMTREERFPGQIRVFTYKHIPYNHFLIVDGSTRQAKMMISHYLYGIRRANCPVVVFSKQSNYDLYRRYRASFKALAKDAKPIEF